MLKIGDRIFSLKVNIFRLVKNTYLVCGQIYSRWYRIKVVHIWNESYITILVTIETASDIQVSISFQF